MNFHYNTSGASETIRMNFLSRNSRPPAKDARTAGLELIVDQYRGFRRT